MKLNKVLPYKLARVLPILGIAGASLFAGCSNLYPRRWMGYYTAKPRRHAPGQSINKRLCRATRYSNNIPGSIGQLEKFRQPGYYRFA